MQELFCTTLYVTLFLGRTAYIPSLYLEIIFFSCTSMLARDERHLRNDRGKKLDPTARICKKLRLCAKQLSNLAGRYDGRRDGNFQREGKRWKDGG